MIEQCPDRWPPADDRDRQWIAAKLTTTYILRFCAVLAPGENLAEYPVTLELTPDEWRRFHDWFGLDINRGRSGDPKHVNDLIVDLRRETTIV
jgi:hypothetical protein